MITMNTIFDKDAYVNQEADLVLQVNLIANFLEQNKTGAKILVIIDCSGSMCGERIELVNQTLKKIHSSLENEDQLTLVPFGSNVGNKIVLYRNSHFSVLTANLGGTNYLVAFREAAKSITKFDRVIFMTDGANNGSNIKDVYEIVKSKFAQIPLTIVGIGSGYNEIYTRNIYENSGKNGAYLHIESSADFAQVYNELCAAKSTVLQLGNLNLVFNSGMSIVSAPDNAKISTRRIVMPIPTLQLNQKYNISCKLKTVPFIKTGQYKVGVATLNYKDCNNELQQVKENIVLNFISNTELISVNENVRKGYELQDLREKFIGTIGELSDEEINEKAKMFEALAVTDAEKEAAMNIRGTLSKDDPNARKKILTNLFSSQR